MFLNTWQKYILIQTLKCFLLLLFCFYGLYFLIDYASRSGSGYTHAHFTLAELGIYYLLECVRRLDVLIPFALLIATVRTLVHMNTQNELVALLAGGVSAKAVVKPLLVLALACTSIVYFSYQYAIPRSLEEMRHIEDIHAREKIKKKRKNFVQTVALKDGSVLLFRDFDRSKELFFDVYWMHSFDKIYHIKELSSKTRPAEGFYVDLLARNAKGVMEKRTSFEKRLFPEIKFNRKFLLDTAPPPQELSLSKLWNALPEQGLPKSEKEAELTTVFYQKMWMPWLSLLVVLATASSCMRFSRHFPQFFVYSFAIFGLVAFLITIDAAIVLGSRQIVSPFVVMGVPFGCFFLFAFVRFLRLR